MFDKLRSASKESSVEGSIITRINYTLKRHVLVFGIFILLGNFAEGGIISSVNVSQETISSGEMGVVSYQITKPTDIVIRVFTEGGGYVRTITVQYQDEQKKEVPWNGKDDFGKEVPAGNYIIRIDTGLTATLDGTFGENGSVNIFTSPFDVEILDNFVFVLDRADDLLYKFNSEGKLVEGFGDKGKILLPDRPNAFKIDTLGNFYVAAVTTEHKVWKYDKDGKLMFRIGAGYKTITLDNGSVIHAPEATLYPVGVGLGPEDRIYITTHGLMNSVYNRNFPDEKGYLYAVESRSNNTPLLLPPKLPVKIDQDTVGPQLTSSVVTGEIWGLTHIGTLRKAQDTGEMIEFKYDYNKTGTDPGGLRNPTGIWYDGQRCLYVADWGNGKVQKFYDSGSGLSFIWSFGQFGQGDLGKGLFQNIHDVAVSFDEKTLYILEDGEGAYDYKAEQPFTFPGAHRLSKWNLRYSDSKEIKIQKIKGADK